MREDVQTVCRLFRSRRLNQTARQIALSVQGSVQHHFLACRFVENDVLVERAKHNKETPVTQTRMQKPFAVTPELEAWLLEAADKPTTPLLKSDFEAIRERVRAKISAA